MLETLYVNWGIRLITTNETRNLNTGFAPVWGCLAKWCFEQCHHILETVPIRFADGCATSGLVFVRSPWNLWRDYFRAVKLFPVAAQ